MLIWCHLYRLELYALPLVKSSPKQRRNVWWNSQSQWAKVAIWSERRYMLIEWISNDQQDYQTLPAKSERLGKKRWLVLNHSKVSSGRNRAKTQAAFHFLLTNAPRTTVGDGVRKLFFWCRFLLCLRLKTWGSPPYLVRSSTVGSILWSMGKPPTFIDVGFWSLSLLFFPGFLLIERCGITAVVSMPFYLSLYAGCIECIV